MGEQQKNAIIRRLSDLESKLDLAVGNSDTEDMFKLETEIHILRVYLRVLECSLKDDTYLDRKHIKLEVNPKVIESLDINSRLSVLCLTKGQCGV